MDEDAATEDKEESLPNDVSQIVHNVLPDDARETDEISTEKGPNEDEAEPIESVTTNQLIDIIVEPSNEVHLETAESPSVAVDITDVSDVTEDHNDISSEMNVSDDMMPIENEDVDAADKNPSISNQNEQNTMVPEQTALSNDQN